MNTYCEQNEKMTLEERGTRRWRSVIWAHLRDQKWEVKSTVSEVGLEIFDGFRHRDTHDDIPFSGIRVRLPSYCRRSGQFVTNADVHAKKT